VLHLVQGHRVAPSLSVAVDDETIALLAITLTEHVAQPHDVADRPKRLVADDQSEISCDERLPIGRRGDPRDIEDDVVKLFTQRSDECADRFSGDLQVVTQRLLGAEYEKTVPDGGHHPLEQGAVNPVRVDERLAQPGVWLDVERERAVAGLQVEIDQCHPAALSVGEMPGQIHRQRRCPDATPSTDQGGHGPELFMDRTGIARTGPVVQRSSDELRGQWLDDVVGDPCVQQITIEADLVAIADRKDGDAGFADLGEGIDLRYRQIDVADVDDQDIR